MTNVIWTTGFEHGTPPTVAGGGLYDLVTGTPTIQGTIKRNGSYALRADSAATIHYVRKNFVSSASCVLSVNLYIDSRDSVSNIMFVRLGGTITTQFLVAKCGQTPVKWGIYNGAAYIDSSASFVNQQWYQFDIYIDGTAKTLNWQVNGTAQTQVTFATGGVVNYIDLGMINSATGVFIIDDVVLSNTGGDYPIGDVQVIGISPNADGTHSAGTNIMENQAGADIGVVTAYDLLNDVPISGSSVYVQQVASGANYAEVLFANVGTSTVKGATAILAYDASSATGANGAAIIIDEDTTSTTIWGSASTVADYSEVTLFYKSIALPTPSGGWDMGAVNALKARVGYKTDSGTSTYWQNLIIEVAYIPSAAPTYFPAQQVLLWRYNMIQARQQSTTTYPITFFMVDSTDHVTGKTGLTPTVTISKNGGAFAAASGAITELTNGWYSYAGHATDRNTLGAFSIHATGTAADPVDIALSIVSYDPFSDVVEGTITLPQALRLILSTMVGKVSGGGTTTITFRDTGDAKNRVVATVDTNGNRSAITLDVT